MPWDQKSAMDQKRRFVADYLSRSFTIVDLCNRHGVSRPTAYKWIGRFLEHGYSGLDELPRRPSRCPHRTADALVEVILEGGVPQSSGKPRNPLTASRKASGEVMFSRCPPPVMVTRCASASRRSRSTL